MDGGERGLWQTVAALYTALERTNERAADVFHVIVNALSLTAFKNLTSVAWSAL